MKFQKQTLRPLFFLFLLTCLLSGLVGVVRVPVNAAAKSIPLFACPASVISQWTFTGDVVTPSTGPGIFASGSGLNPAAPPYTYFGGPANSAISFSSWGIAYDPNDYLEFAVDTTGNTDIGISFDYRSTGTGPNTVDLYYFIDATPMMYFVGSRALTTDSNFHTLSFDLSAIPALNNNPNAKFRLHAYGATAPAGDLRIDNVTISSICPPPIDVVINEVAWAGTQAFSGDEWIELYNATGTPIDLINWRLEAADGDPIISLGTSTSYYTIPAMGYLLLERGSPNVTNVPPSGTVNIATYFSGLLNNSGETLYLIHENSQIVDTANSNGGAWPAGSGLSPFSSMERTIIAPDSDFTWVTFAGATTALAANSTPIFGTPGVANSQPGVTPTITLTPTLTPTATATATLTATSSPTRTLTPTITSTALTPATSIVISEFRTIGPSGANDEFIELYNPTALPVSIGGWMIKRSSICGTTVATIVNIPAAVTLASGQHYLIGGTTYSGAVTPDQANISLGIGDTGGLALFLADGVTIVDQVGLCASTLYREGTAITAVVANANQSWDRKSSLTGLCVDSNNNVQDFILRRPSDPQNFASTLTRCGNPTPTPTITPPQTSAPKPTRTRTPQPPPLPPPPPLIAISEFVPRPGHDWNIDGVIDIGDEYIELINHGVIDVNLSGYSLDDEANIGSSPFQLPAEILKPGERIVFYGKETGLLLSDGGDGVRLIKPNGQLGDAYNYTVVRYPDQSYCRLPDDGGLDFWNQNCFPTPGLKNSLNGNFSNSPTEADDDLPLCPISDTLPVDFAWAECPSFGNIWSRFYWDAKGWLGEMTIPDIDSKWDVYVD